MTLPMPKPSVSKFNSIETDSGADCYFCNYRHTNYAVVYGNKMLRICGPCARGLRVVLRAIDIGDER